MEDVEHLFIVGAGFSAHAGLPLTSEFTNALIGVEHFEEAAPSRRLVEFLRQFVSDTFDHSFTADARFWPHLEDVFTSLDLAANTGHHLGPIYAPSDLRTVRRALIARTIRMLRQTYTRGREAQNPAWHQLETFFRCLLLPKSAFLSMNWDTVVEAGLAHSRNVMSFDYRCDANPVHFSDDGALEPANVGDPGALLIKMHGSSNWLYCDSCRAVFWVRPSSTFKVASLLFQKRDWETLSRIMNTDMDERDEVAPTKCPSCQAPSIGTRFATFSYRKALDFPMYERSWLEAERLLRQARTWIFIGYSLPAADYQFKHLLKHVQLSRPDTPTMILISGGAGAVTTLKHYQRFFGPKISRKREAYFDEGLNDSALERLRELGVINHS